MVKSELVTVLKSVDLFHKTCILMLSDFISYVKDRLLGKNLFMWEDVSGYGVWHKVSQHVGNFVFEHNNCLKFAFLLIKANEDAIRNGPGYKDVCADLQVDLRFPLLFVTGVYQPLSSGNADQFRKDLNLRRAWPQHLLKLQVPDHVLQKVKCSSPYCFNQELSFETDPSVGNWWCNSAQFKIWRVTDIKDQKTLVKIADELLCKQG